LRLVLGEQLGINVRFTPKSGHNQHRRDVRLCQKRTHAPQQRASHSINSPAAFAFALATFVVVTSPSRRPLLMSLGN
jgi:hypothetical protein